MGLLNKAKKISEKKKQLEEEKQLDMRLEEVVEGVPAEAIERKEEERKVVLKEEGVERGKIIREEIAERKKEFKAVGKPGVISQFMGGISKIRTTISSAAPKIRGLKVPVIKKGEKVKAEEKKEVKAVSKPGAIPSLIERISKIRTTISSAAPKIRGLKVPVIKKEVKEIEKREILEKKEEVYKAEEKKEPKAAIKPEAMSPLMERISKIRTLLSSSILPIIKIAQQILIVISRVIFNLIALIKKVIIAIDSVRVGIARSIRSIILKILGNLIYIVKNIRSVITGIPGIIFWGVSAVIRVFVLILEFVIGAQDKIINTVTTKAKHITPKSLITEVEGVATHGGVEKTSSQIIGSTTIYAVIFSMFAGIVAFSLNLSGILVFISFVGGFAIVFIIVWVVLGMLADRRAESVDAVLPDVLQIVSINMVAGMTPYNSLLVAARPEFGPLAEEIHKAVQDTMSGKPLVDSLRDMTTRVKSDKLKRCVNLMVQGMNSGGDLSKVLQGIAKDIRYVQGLQKEMKANTTGYSMFILFAILIGTPLLLGVSITFVQIFSAIFSTIDVSALEGAGQTTMISLKGLSITPEFFRMYAIAVLIISGFCGGVMIGVIQSGKASAGFTMGPILAIVAVVIFYVLQATLISVFGGAIVK